ncbi:hypothetical protein DPEC_G00052310 [Dallia pectoralis]|uniref:Uncharacterized protein n=1 Tax=Dallia pectoralis TaxID=75939 RepID=A0ACC2HBG9_DALPE|nr:hypothetical protein DPEC_G00052310 [Dallia pectoralis]
MSSLQQLRSFFKHSLAAVADEIFAVVEKAITEYQDELSRSEEKNSRLQNLLDIAVKHETKLYRADTEPRLQLPVCEEVPPQQQYHDQEWNPNLGQEDQNSMHIKEELMETSLGNEQESDTSYIFTSTCLQRDCDQELPQPSHEAFSQPPSAVESTYPSSSPISCCKVCGKTFLKKTYFFKHVRMHTKVRERVCGFSVSCNLTQHMMIHTGERPYHCPNCQKGFITMVKLRRHQNAVHMQGETSLL